MPTDREPTRNEVFRDKDNTLRGNLTLMGAFAAKGTLGFHGATPGAQRAGAAQAAVATTGSTLVAYGYTTAAQADAIVTLLNEIRAALVEKGIIKGAA